MAGVAKNLPAEIRTAARDLAYVAVGLGVLGYQRLQVERARRRREHHPIYELLATPVRFAGRTMRGVARQVPTEATALVERALGEALRRGRDLGRIVRSR